MALEVPLWLNLERRALAELTAQTLAQAQAIASIVGDRQEPSAGLDAIVGDAARTAKGRVIVVDAGGELVGDSAGPGLIGSRYATPDRPEILTALRDGVPETTVRDSETLGTEILATAVPILVGGDPRGAVRITVSMGQVQANVRRSVLGLVAIGMAALVSGLLIAFVLAGSLARPLRRLAAATRRLGAGDLSSRSGNVGGPTEVREVAGGFDEMAARLEALVRAQREFAGNASHQLRTPLTGLKLRLEAAGARAPAEVRADLEAAEREVDRLAGVVERLLSLSRTAERGKAAVVDLGEAVRRAAARWEIAASRAGATLEIQADAGRVLADASDLDQVLDVLVDNAIRYAGGRIVLQSGSDGGRAFAAVEDRGPGIAPDDLARVTERFYRGRRAPPGGSGLGLAVGRELTERWGGSVRVERADPAGIRVEVWLPSAGIP